MGHYQVKPPRIEARQVPEPDSSLMDWIALEKWCGGTIMLEIDDKPYAIQVTTGDRLFLAHVSDWIIKQANGYFYWCSDKTFKATYEETN